MSLENISFDVTITIIDKDTKKKAGQLRYHTIDSEIEIFDTYLFPEYRRKKIMSSLLKKITSELKMSGVTKIKLRPLDDVARIAWESMGFRQIDEKGNMELYLN
jgi:GNAT superfamily N-acetyltransferase